MKLSIELSKWRCDRPDEWKMDEFIRNAEKLQADRDALAAHCISLKGFIQSCADSHLEDGEQEAADMYLNQVNLTPDFCLASHDAEVAKKAVQAALRMYGNTDLNNKEIIALSESYAASLNK